MRQKHAPRAWGERQAGTLTVVCVLLLAVLLNMVFYALTETFSLYLYAETKYEHTIGPGVKDGLAAANGAGDPVEIIFCMPEDALQDDPVYRLVRETARQLDEAFDFLSVRAVNAVARPDEVDDYRYVLQKDEETGAYTRVEAYTVGRESVIVAGPLSHTVLSMPSFFVLDDNNSIEAYRGEEVMTGMILYALSDTHPKAYITQSHGESAGTGLYDLLVCAGYELTPIDLLSQTPEDTDGIFVISNPTYDFYRGGTGVEAEIEKLRAYMEAGGFVMIFLDPLACWDGEGQCKLPNLFELMAEWGMSPTPAIIRDNAASVTSDGYTLVVAYAEDEEAQALRQTAQPYNTSRIILREAAALSVSDAEGKTAAPLLRTSATAAAYFGDRQLSAEGNYAVAGVSTMDAPASGRAGGMSVCTSYYLGARDALGSDEYGNTSFLYALLSRYRGQATPLGATKLRIGSTLLRDLTVREARLWALAVVGLPTLAVAAVGFVLLRRRRGR